MTWWTRALQNGAEHGRRSATDSCACVRASSTLRRSARGTRSAQTYVGQDEEEERGDNDSDWSAGRDDESEGDSDAESDAYA
eukprot:g18248.t1